MNIIIINGSPRKNGVTAKILHKMEETLQLKENVNIEFIHIADLEINPCSGCCSCYKTGYCYIEDDAERLSKKISLADGLIIGSPTYASNLSGILKQFIDRGHFVIEQLLYDKYVVSVVTGENYGSQDASKILTKLLKYSGGKLSGKIVCNVPFNSNHLNKKVQMKINYLADKIFVDISQKRKYRIQSLVQKIIFKFGIESFVKSKGEKYNGVVKRWREHHIIKNKF
ncbi:MAG: flavodoxin family protein [Lachnospiraceae bacterium]|nr:flavodoxin family protein [Lachnospiraceae bacterium]